MAARFDILRVRGSNYEIGLQLGEAMKRTIPKAIDQIYEYELGVFYKMLTKGENSPHIPEMTREKAIEKTREFLPLFERYCPGVLDELRGIAKGAGVTFEEALLLQVRGEVVYAMSAGCTAFALSGRVTKSGRVLIGQNWDYKVDLDLLHLLHVTPNDAPARLMFTFVGLTSFMGLNSKGVSHFGNSLPWGWCNVAIPHYPIKWRIYHETTMDGVRAVLNQTKTVQPGNYVLCDGKGDIADAELTPEGIVWLEDTDGFFVHTNHFLGEPFASRADLPPLLVDSVPRYERLRSLVKANVGKIDVPMLREFLSDHEHYPTSICRHEESMYTSASMIAEPERGLMHVCAGNPCTGEFVTHEV